MSETELLVNTTAMAGDAALTTDHVEPPRVGDSLHASCSNVVVGTVTRVGVDENGAPVIDLLVSDYNEFLNFEDETAKFQEPPLTRLKLSEGASMTLTDLQYVRQNVQTRVGFNDRVYEGIECRTPEGGCYRCSKWFSLWRGGKRPE